MTSINAIVKTATLTALCRKMRPSRSMLIRGNHGIGKSAIVRQIANHFRLHLIDFRLGQRTPGDVIGMPDLSSGVTLFRPPAELLRATREPCLLFFDELNRACDEVLQAVFQICLDRKLPDGTPLDPATRVYAAINNAAVYNVGRLDPALLDRFAVFDLMAEAKDWIDWAQRPVDHPDEGGGIDEVMISFIAANNEMLFPVAKCEPESVQPSPRSWHALHEDLKHAGLLETPDDPLFYALSVASLGVEVATVWTRYAQSVDNRITGQDVLDRYAADPTDEDHEYVLTWNDKAGKPQKRTETWKVGRLQAKARKLPIDGLLNLVESVGKVVCAMTGPGTAEQAENLKRFCTDLDPELKVNLWAALTANGIDAVDTVRWWHPAIAEDIVTGAFKVPVGEDGIGVSPNIPSSLANKGG
jgi:hypothetical protein